MDTVVVRLPDRTWAECAKTDLETEGLEVRMAAEADGDGLWALSVRGCSTHVEAIRLALQPGPPAFDWARLVNSLLA